MKPIPPGLMTTAMVPGTGCPPAQSQPSQVDIGMFYDELAARGTWVERQRTRASLSPQEPMQRHEAER